MHRSPGLHRGSTVPDITPQGTESSMAFLDLSRYSDHTRRSMETVYHALYEDFYPLVLRRLLYLLLQLPHENIIELFEIEYATAMETICGTSKLFEVLTESYFDGSLLFVRIGENQYRIVPLCYNRTQLAMRLSGVTDHSSTRLVLSTDPEFIIAAFTQNDDFLFPEGEQEADQTRLEALSDDPGLPTEDSGPRDAGDDPGSKIDGLPA